MAGCSLGHEPCLLHINRWDADQTKKYTLNNGFSNIASVILGSSYNSDV